MALGKDGPAGWLLGDRPSPPRAELYSSRGDWKATWGCSGGGVSLSLTHIFSLLGRPLDDVSLSPVAEGSKIRRSRLLFSPNCLILSGWFVGEDKIKRKINITYSTLNIHLLSPLNSCFIINFLHLFFCLFVCLVVQIK